MCCPVMPDVLNRETGPDLNTVAQGYSETGGLAHLILKEKTNTPRVLLCPAALC